MLLSTGGRGPWIGIQNAPNYHGAPLPTHPDTVPTHTGHPPGACRRPPPTCEPPMRPSSTSRAPAITSHGPSARFPLIESRPGRAGRAALPWQPRDTGLGPGQRPPTKWRRGAQNGAGPAGARRGEGGGGAREEGSALCAAFLRSRESCGAASGVLLLLRHRGRRAVPRFGVIAARPAERQDRGSGASHRLASARCRAQAAEQPDMASGMAPLPPVCPCPSVPRPAAVQSRQR